jgi:hypothetical protein
MLLPSLIGPDKPVAFAFVAPRFPPIAHIVGTAPSAFKTRTAFPDWFGAAGLTNPAVAAAAAMLAARGAL